MQMKLCVCKLDTLSQNAKDGGPSSLDDFRRKTKSLKSAKYKGFVVGIKCVGHFWSHDRVSPTELIRAIFHD